MWVCEPICRPPPAARSYQLTEDRLRLGADLHASSRARHLGLGQQIVGFPEVTNCVRPGGPGQHQTETETQRVLIVGDVFSEDLREEQRQRLSAEMAHRQLTLAEASLTQSDSGWQVVALNPLPEVWNEAEIELIARYLLDVAQLEKGAA